MVACCSLAFGFIVCLMTACAAWLLIIVAWVLLDFCLIICCLVGVCLLVATLVYFDLLVFVFGLLDGFILCFVFLFV